MSKVTLNSISSGFNSTTALNTNFDIIKTAFDNTLSLDGSSPNQLRSNLDMNGYAILNQRATSGNENFVWLGTWVTGTTYVVNNLVYAPEGTNEGATLICVTAHTAGATLNGDSAKWAVFAQRGASGAGTGDVIGPASSTADSLARFSGTTGKLLKNGAVIGTDIQAWDAQLDALALLSTGTASGNIPIVGNSSATEALAGLVELATTVEAATGTDTARAVTPAGLGASVIGIGQTWQTVARGSGTPYTNLTGKPIMVSVWCTSTASGAIVVVVGGVTILNIAGDSGDRLGASFIVPDNTSYTMTSNVGSIVVSELRA